MRRMMLCRKRGDRGAMVVLVTLVTTVVLLGVGAIVLNTGWWYSERGQLQNGTDAAALAVAQSCGRGTCDTSLAVSLINNNHNHYSDTTASDVVVCGQSTGSASPLTACTSDQANGSYCPAAPANGANFVNVHTTTPTNDSIPVIGALTGPSRRINACAQARWGAPSTCSACIPMTISLCEWYKDTNNGTQFASAPTTPAGAPSYSVGSTPFTSPPSYLATLKARSTDPAYGTGASNYFFANSITDPETVAPAPRTSAIAGSETVLLAHSSGTTGFGGSSCNSGSDASNQTSPGEFGWLCSGSAGCNSGCAAAISPPTYTGGTGTAAPACQQVFTTSRNNIQPIYLPVFSTITGTGSNTTYTLQGFAAFVVTGWGGLNSGNGFTTTGCDSIVTANDSSLGSPYGPGYTGTNCSTSFPKVKGKSIDYADYCDNYLGVSNCNGNGHQAIYGYFTKALIPASDLPGGSGGGANLGATGVGLSG